MKLQAKTAHENSCIILEIELGIRCLTDLDITFGNMVGWQVYVKEQGCEF